MIIKETLGKIVRIEHQPTNQLTLAREIFRMGRVTKKEVDAIERWVEGSDQETSHKLRDLILAEVNAAAKGLRDGREREIVLFDHFRIPLSPSVVTYQ